jgi:hypothetical protein
MTDTILCPHCQQEIPISEALSTQVRNELKGEMEKNLEIELHKRLAKESVRLQEEAAKAAKAELTVQLEDLKAQTEEKSKKLEQYQSQELELRKEKRLLEEQKQTMELDIARKLDEERKKVESEVLRKVTEENRLKEMEKDKQIEDFKRQVEDMKHKIEVGSQQARGEVQELDLEEMLRVNFSGDDITPVGKGVLGADIIQHVRNRYGKLCEKIIWESKRTKHWSDQWVDKLKDDARKMSGFVSVIVTETLPADIKGFGYYNGVWVTDYHSIIGLTTALRMQIIHVCHVRDSIVGKDEKMEMLYNYLTSHQFRQRVEAIVETFQTMRTDLDKEREAMRRLWAKREKEIERITENTIGMYGEMQGLVGSGMPSLPALDLMAIAGQEEDDSQPQAPVTISLPLHD